MPVVALHKGKVYWERSGWAPKHFPASLKTAIRGRLQDKILFGSDSPSLPLDRLLREWDELGFSAEIMDKVLHANAERVLDLPAAAVPTGGDASGSSVSGRGAIEASVGGRGAKRGSGGAAGAR